MLGKLTLFPSAFFHPHGRKASKDTVETAPGVFSSERSRSAKREDQRRRKHAGAGPDRLTYSFSTARMIAL